MNKFLVQQMILILVLIDISITEVVDLKSIQNTNAVACDYYDTTNVTEGSMLADKSWLHNGLRYANGFYAQFDYILDPLGTKISVPYHVRGCTCLIKPCLTSCCKKYERINATASCTGKFTQEDLMWEIGFDNDTDLMNVNEAFHWVERRPDCVEKVFLEPETYPEDRWNLLMNGSIYIPFDDQFVKYGEHCIAVDENENKIIVLKCHVQLESSNRYWFLGIGMLLSVPFLLATFIVYAFIPELRNVHGKSLMSYVGGLTVGYAFLGSVQLIGERDECQSGSISCYNKTFCVLSGYTIYFSFMLSFFWLNTMCFDIYWTFRAVRSNISARKKFNYYCIYSWGMASLMTIILLFGHQFGSDAINPKIGDKSCFLAHEGLVEFLYLYLILLILVCMNIIFFVITSFKIKKAQAETSAVVDAGNSSKHSRQTYDKYRFMLYLRLFIIMGDLPLLFTVTWSMELLSWVVDPDSPVFFGTDLVNCLQGILIFILVVCNNKVRKLVVKRYYHYKGIPDPKSNIHTDVTRTAMSSSFSKDFSLEQRGSLLNKENDINHIKN